ncbi:MAG TPA: MerR family transcriptional regulator [Ktedonobacterales bacterium]|nr:MerR family transcriptional regulator [Ktedonobacterales bacterium]
MNDLMISEVARRASVRPSAIRYYESVGLLPAPRRVNGQRRYDASVLQALAIIQLAQQAGFTIPEIRTLFTGFAPDTPISSRWQTLAQTKLAEVDALILRAQSVKRLLEEGILRCRCLTFEECAALIQRNAK